MRDFAWAITSGCLIALYVSEREKLLANTWAQTWQRQNHIIKENAMESIISVTREDKVKGNDELDLLVKRNSDGSYSAKVSAGDLIKYAFVDFYNDTTGEGYQRNESGRDQRGRQIELYMGRAIRAQREPALFEMTGNIRPGRVQRTKFEALDVSGELGIFKITFVVGARFLSMIDGATRLLGIEKAVASGIADAELKFDVRVFDQIPFAEEVAYFLLINDTQKKVRTDLSLRVVQQLFDNGKIRDGSDEFVLLQNVLPSSEYWKYKAVRMVGELNNNPRSRWFQRIQMPGDPPQNIALQAYFSSLKQILNNAKIVEPIKAKIEQGLVFIGDRQLIDKEDYDQYLLAVLNNFWEAIAGANEGRAYREPDTTVLWAPIGVSAHNFALSPILAQLMLQKKDWNFSIERFGKMLKNSLTDNYEFWYTKSGQNATDTYPKHKGDATIMTGLANYGRLAEQLERDWALTLFQDVDDTRVSI
jgi:hypothetical protein